MHPFARLAALTLFLLLPGCSALGPASTLFSKGGEIELREQMRPVRGTTRVLVLAFDGVSDAVLRTALADGSMPHLGAFLGARTGENLYANAYAVPGVVAIMPSETAAGWSAVFTGRAPGENGIAGNEWFDRDSLRSWAPVPISTGTYKETIRIYSGDLLGGLIAVPTLFERAGVRAHVAMGFVARGADLRNPPDLNDFDDLFEVVTEKLTGVDPLGAFKELDEDTWEGVKGSTGRHGLPDLQIAYFPGVDLATHGEGPRVQREYLRTQTDKHVGRILDLYRRHGVLSNTYVVVVADHGHTETRADDRHSLDVGDDEPTALFDTLGYRLRAPGIGVDSSDYQAVVAYNEATAAVYLADRSTCPDEGDRCDWTRGPRLDADVLPLARAFYRASVEGAYVPALQGTLDLVLARTSRDARGESPPFQVFDGQRLVPVPEYLAANPRPDLVALERRLGWLTSGTFGHRAGDLLLMAKNGAERPIDDRYYFGPAHASGHGSAARSDGIIPLMVARAGASGATLRDVVTGAVGEAPTQLDITNLILSLLGVAR
ncbi:MAG TPA: alkaline phosphatase family protein [Rhodothermales bacterium]|nr:alkaline phosphatase family protein [Rhodothermales bacterium]